MYINMLLKVVITDYRVYTLVLCRMLCCLVISMTFQCHLAGAGPPDLKKSTPVQPWYYLQ